MSTTKLPVPDFFDPARVGEIWQVPYQARAAQARAWAQEHGISPAARDQARVALLLVDVQNTFCLPTGELSVLGAVEDNVRLCRFIYENLGVITAIHPTMDTHTAMQIFHTVFWVAGAAFTDPATGATYQPGEHPNPATIISREDVEQNRWQVNPAVAFSVAGGNYVGLQRHALHYVRTLEKGGKYPLMVWPYHAMLGGVSHALVAAVEEACFFHAIVRASQTGFEIKGGNPLTENYSVLSAEVLTGADGAPIAQKNTRFISTLLKFDVVVIGGQAKSHCVAWTIDHLLTEITAQDPALARKVYLLEDCTSPVVIPGVVDFTAPANEAFELFAAAGMHVVQSTAPITTWDGVPPF